MFLAKFSKAVLHKCQCLGRQKCRLTQICPLFKLCTMRLGRQMSRPVCFMSAITIIVTIMYFLGYIEVMESYNALYRRSRSEKLILFWNHYEDDIFYKRLNGLLDNQKCPVSNCKFTTSRSDFQDADAVVFIPILHRSFLPKRAFKSQLYVLYNMEPPTSFIGYPFEKYKDQYNLVMTYLDHPDTDVRIPLGYITSRMSDQGLQKVNMKLKTHSAAWVVSNCNATGQRWAYATDLSKYIHVDVFGECGALKCGHHCFKDIEKKYRFYFAFEKCYCAEYLTEKVFRTLNFNIIPIVLGGANYTEILPEHSYIDVTDYKSPHHLADYLKELEHDNHKYMEYFAWKKYKKSVDGRNKTVAFCHLCQLLNDRSYPYKTHFNLEEYWNPDDSCLRGHDEKSVLGLS